MFREPGRIVSKTYNQPMLKRILTTLLLFILFSLIGAFVWLFPHVIADLWLSGHNYTWHQTPVVPGGVTDWLDLIWMVFTLGTGLFAGVVYWGKSGKQAPLAEPDK